MTGQGMTAEEFDEYFDEGGDISGFIDPAKVSFPNAGKAERRVNLNMPAWLVEAVDAKAKRLGANRQSYINMTLAESVEQPT